MVHSHTRCDGMGCAGNSMYFSGGVHMHIESPAQPIPSQRVCVCVCDMSKVHVSVFKYSY